MQVIRITHPNCKPKKLRQEHETVSIERTYGETLKTILEQRGSFMLLEHDIDPTKDQLKKIEAFKMAFPKAILAAKYMLYPVTTGLKHPVCAHRPKFGEWLYCQDFKRIEYFGLGCTYIPHEAARLIDPQWDYPALDYLLSEAWKNHGGKAYALPLWIDHHHKD